MPTALIVDDDLCAQELNEFLLSQAGFEVSVVDSGERALELLRKRLHDVVVLDIMMPGLDGLAVCREIRKDSRLKDVKIAVVTTKAFDSDREAALRFGADIFIVKPYEVETFPRLIMDLIAPDRPSPSPGKAG